MPYLFVYGTLRKGYAGRCATMLSRTACYVGSAKVRGRLYRVAHYPGLVASAGGDDWVHGDVYRIDRPAGTLRMLDRYEGSEAPHEFRRTTATVVLESGEAVEALVYAYARSASGLKRIVSGDFLNPRLRHGRDFVQGRETIC